MTQPTAVREVLRVVASRRKSTIPPVLGDGLHPARPDQVVNRPHGQEHRLVDLSLRISGDETVEEPVTVRRGGNAVDHDCAP